MKYSVGQKLNKGRQWNREIIEINAGFYHTKADDVEVIYHHTDKQLDDEGYKPIPNDSAEITAAIKLLEEKGKLKDGKILEA